ncbi:CPBP family intramembrane glutamic endopeptidase [Nocardiopsis changdeensis]|uniref:CPBP family intramembrane metalloprotease n=1 Tax=Nocardiopsis changdeensis TaxID=2831969 RepID=A0ABX8BGD2_9ACTN|nr:MULTISPECIES: type II CAAX endopeptidase family protein [Nocardiopsis]QUX20815.1 CPBP family intramembrane metalloprotease [Nocardiopsis changdeensis]QYX36747.1 CPBP family intramembrane metalloprotease [Nocardiopsis sp. MT53]
MTAETLPVRPRPNTGLPYHRLTLLEHRTSRWWRPLATVAVACALFVVLGLLSVVVLPLASMFVTWLPEPSDADSFALDNPTDVLLTFGMLALMIPAVLLGARWGGGRSRILHSVAGRLRWRMMLTAAAVLVPLYAAVYWGAFLLDPPADASVPRADPMLVVGLLLCLALVPLQCAAEEYAFRGLPQQVLGTWLRSPLWGIVLPVPLFMLGHGYDWVGQVDIAVFALCMGFLVWKSGGLELAIAVHTANNLTLLLAAPFSPSSLDQGAVDPATLLISVPLTLVSTAGLALWFSRVHGLRPFEPLRGTGGAQTVPAPDALPREARPAAPSL